MLILAFESSCDETAAAVVEMGEGTRRIRSSVVASQVDTHALYGGAINEFLDVVQLCNLATLEREFHTGCARRLHSDNLRLGRHLLKDATYARCQTATSDGYKYIVDSRTALLQNLQSGIPTAERDNLRRH